MKTKSNNVSPWRRRADCLIWLVPSLLAGCIVGLAVGLGTSVLAIMDAWSGEGLLRDGSEGGGS